MRAGILLHAPPLGGGVLHSEWGGVYWKYIIYTIWQGVAIATKFSRGRGSNLTGFFHWGASSQRLEGSRWHTRLERWMMPRRFWEKEEKMSCGYFQQAQKSIEYNWITPPASEWKFFWIFNEKACLKRSEKWKILRLSKEKWKSFSKRERAEIFRIPTRKACFKRLEKWKILRLSKRKSKSFSKRERAEIFRIIMRKTCFQR